MLLAQFGIPVGKPIDSPGISVKLKSKRNSNISKLRALYACERERMLRLFSRIVGVAGVDLQLVRKLIAILVQLE